MNEIENLVVTALNSLADDIRQNMAEANENATGRTQASFEVVVTPEAIKLVAKAGDRATLESLEKGVPPLTEVPVEALEEWANVKFGMTGEELTKFARKVKYKIFKVGTDRYSANVDIYTTATQQTAELLTKELSYKITEQIKNELVNIFDYKKI